MPFCPSSPGWSGCLFFTKWKNGGAELWIFLQWHEQGSLQSLSSGPRALRGWDWTQKSCHIPQPPRPPRDKQGLHNIWNYTSQHDRIFWAGRNPQPLLSPTLQWMAHTRTKPLLSAPCSDQLSQPQGYSSKHQVKKRIQEIQVLLWIVTKLLPGPQTDLWSWIVFQRDTTVLEFEGLEGR